MKKIIAVLLTVLHSGFIFAAQATLPYTYSSGTTISSTQVNSNEQELQSKYNAHDTGVTAVHGMGASSIVGTLLTQTLTNKTLIAPAFSGVSTGDLTLTATNKLRLDGSASGDTYLVESGANQIDFYVGGNLALEMLATRDMALQATEKLYLDGGTNTYLLEDSADHVSLYTGGGQNFIFNGANSNGMLELYGRTSDAVEGGRVAFYKNRAGGAITSGDDIGGIYAYGHSGVTSVVSSAIYFDSEGTIAADRVPGQIRFLTHPDDTNPVREVLRMDCNGHVTPRATAGTQALGDATYYWGDISYKTLTDRGCLGWFDEGVEMQDGTKVSDTQALLAIKKDETKKTIYGVPMLDYKTFPKVAYKKAEVHGKLLPRDANDEPIGGQDGIEMTSMFSVMIGATKELTLRVEALEKENIELKKRLDILEAK